MEPLEEILATRPELIVGPLVTVLMWVVTRVWRNPERSEVTKLKQSLSAGLMVAVLAIGAQVAEVGWEEVNWPTTLATGIFAWWVSMGAHSAGKRGLGALRVLRGEDH